jgi:hypothetical protein
LDNGQNPTWCSYSGEITKRLTGEYRKNDTKQGKEAEVIKKT